MNILFILVLILVVNIWGKVIFDLGNVFVIFIFGFLEGVCRVVVMIMLDFNFIMISLFIIFWVGVFFFIFFFSDNSGDG